ncbi:hypothetical protein [Kitasatospora sp. McL0602]|uniref:hypothetical protein n=1 Tax=Kitasatospora sp. McL0602 TaxID=3439530 RepID=UPI003F8BE382
MKLISRRVRWGVSAVVLAGAAAAAAVLLWPQSEKVPPLVAAANYSGRPTACLAADSTSQPMPASVSAVWGAMQKVSSGRPINVQQLVVAAATHDQAMSYLEGLVAQHCTLIISVSPSFTSALPEIAKASPNTRLVAVVDAGHPAPKGVNAVTGSADDQATEIGRQVGALA